MQFTVNNPDYKENIVKHCQRQEFMKLIGCRLTIIEPGYVVAEIERTEQHQQQMGIIHGGVIASLADIAAGFSGFTLVHSNQHTVTVELKTSFLFPANGSKIKAIGKVLKQGSTLIFSECEVFSYEKEQWLLVAKATGTFAIVTPKSV